MKVNQLIKLFVLALLLIVAYYYGKSSDQLNIKSTSPKNTAIITSISPDILKPLKIGHEVTIEVQIEYELIDESADVSLVIQRNASKRQEPITFTTKQIKKGIGTLSLSSSFTVPDTNNIQIFTPLMTHGTKDTVVVDSRIYKVVHNSEE